MEATVQNSWMETIKIKTINIFNLTDSHKCNMVTKNVMVKWLNVT